ncbi:MAG: cadherin repeat domain-containing protein [Pseudomonadota bacterium]
MPDTSDVLLDFGLPTGVGDPSIAMTVPENVAPFIPEPHVYFVEENTVTAAFLTAIDPENDPITFAISGGEDGAQFSIDAVTGELSFFAPPDFETPADFDQDNVYVVDITVSDALSNSTQTIVVQVVNSDPPPPGPIVIDPAPTEPFAPVRGYINQNSVNVLHDVALAGDPAPDGFTFALFGEDAGSFEIDSATGEITLDPAVDISGSFDGDLIYEVIVLVDNGFGDTATLEIDYLMFVGG